MIGKSARNARENVVWYIAAATAAGGLFTRLFYLDVQYDRIYYLYNCPLIGVFYVM